MAAPRHHVPTVQWLKLTRAVSIFIYYIHQHCVVAKFNILYGI